MPCWFGFSPLTHNSYLVTISKTIVSEGVSATELVHLAKRGRSDLQDPRFGQCAVMVHCSKLLLTLKRCDVSGQGPAKFFLMHSGLALASKGAA